MYEIDVLHDIRDLEKLRSFWDEHQTYPYSDLDYYLYTYELEDPFLAPFVVVASQEGTPAAIVIGRILSKRISWRVGYKKVFKPTLRALEFVYNGALGDLTAETCDAIVAEIARGLDDGLADICYFNQLAVDSELFKAVQRQAHPLFRDRFTNPSPHHTMTLPDGFDAFLAERSKKSRWKIRQYGKKLEKNFEQGVRFECYDRADQVDTAMDHIETVARTTYQRGMGVGFFHTAETADKWRYAADRGWLQAYVLYLNDVPAAFWTGFLYKRTFLSSTTGFDPQHGDYGPGTFVLLKMIEEYANRDDCDVIDFGVGDAGYKKMYATDCVDEAKLFMFPTGAKGLRLQFMHSSTKLAGLAATKVLERFELMDDLKKKWRRRLRAD